jgi:hypothetical protein
LWVCTRRPKDGSTTQQRAETLAYVASRFQDLGQSESHTTGLYRVNDGELVIVAFGLNITLYYWRKSGDEDEDEGFLEPHMHFDDYGKEEARLEMETKILTPLVKEWQETLEKDTAYALAPLGLGS